jgi:hypothetical protein
MEDGPCFFQTLDIQTQLSKSEEPQLFEQYTMKNRTLTNLHSIHIKSGLADMV